MPDAQNFAAPFLDKKHTIIILQWLVVIATSYLLLFSGGQISQDPRVYGLILLYLFGSLVLQRLPPAVFQHDYFDAGLLIADTVLISASIYMNRNVPWDLFLFYFFILFLAAIGENMARVAVGSAVISLVYLGLLIQQARGFTDFEPDQIIRVPFLFGTSILYGYLSENTRREKLRAQSAEQKERLKMDLVAALAHDIKNPLGNIMGYTELMSQDFAQREDEKACLEMLKRIQENADRIVNLVTGFLEASRAEAGKLEIAHRPVHIDELLKEAARQQESDLTRKRLTVELDLDEKLPDVIGDEGQLDRVFWNLLGNAIKFTPVGGKITVSSRRDGDYISVSIKDTGIGIPEEELPLLFSQFRRLKGSEKIEGTGLGLFIVKTIIEAHKGTVDATSAPGQGSTFTVRVPIRS